MFGVPLRYLLKHPATIKEIVADPIEVWTTLRENYLADREPYIPPSQYATDVDWERRMHASINFDWPCPAAIEFWGLWQEVMRELETKGLHAGPQSFLNWNDGDAAFVRAIWCLTRHLKPEKVVETGVAHGVTSRFILEALERNGRGHLWSIDLPPLEHAWREQVAVAVSDRNRKRWTYIKGSSRRRLPHLLRELGQIDVFVHDSLHSARNVRFEMDRAWPCLRASGAIIVDDIDINWGFHSFTRAFADRNAIVCEADPLHPDLRRFNQKGLFGLCLKSSSEPVLSQGAWS